MGGGCGELAGREESTSENSNRSGEKQKGLLEFLREGERERERERSEMGPLFWLSVCKLLL